MPFLPCAPWLCCAFLLIASTALKAADPKETTSPTSTPTIPSAATAAKGDPAASPWPGDRVDPWHGFVRHRFAVDGATAWVVEPRQAAPGKPWSWCLEFPDAFTDRTGVLQLLEHGFHHVHLEVGNTFGSPRALEQFEAFYQVLQRGGLGPKAALGALAAAVSTPTALPPRTRNAWRAFMATRPCAISRAGRAGAGEPGRPAGIGGIASMPTE